ncbi:hypothetical protein DYB25_004162 [Aphanomyces astaci]|uniref:Sideroflexin n=1 Tax=Aphanomyces astaci TaxID=112090 RepID=A0A397AWH8_APHAT|nr:hypothetical protein DYB25_004162 [Aphanomyces astaci]RHY80235.1 hypothetical protein DYB31_008872 [Aphanomyces astaci]
MNQRYVSGFLLSDDEIAKSQQLIDNFKTGTLAPGQVPDADLWKARREAYASAVAISCATSVGLGKAVERASFLAPTVRSVLSKTVPFVAVAAAGAGNAVFMRLSELSDGIDILDDEGVPRGRSQEAGKQSLTQVALTRVALPVPILLFPPFILEAVKKANALPKNRFGRVFTEIGIVTLCIWGAFPAAIALFPQYGSIPASQVEPQFQHLKNSKGQPITEFTYNKGI